MAAATAAAELRTRDRADLDSGLLHLPDRQLVALVADDDLLVARLAADLTTAARVDLSWCDPGGVEHMRMSDVPIWADAGAVIFQHSITWAKASPTSTMIARLVAVEENGDERLLGEYGFHHTRTIPGPPGWEV